MAGTTSTSLRGKMMYQVFVRNFSKEGTFAAVKDRLSYIRSLGTDIVWLMPIHPIGKVKRKGTLGSPYAVRDYRSVNPEFGTLEDFVSLVDEIHSLGMKCIIDVVYNHTSPDSVLAEAHPEWFYHKPDGSFGNRVGDWSDIIDLDYSHRELWKYQTETLKYWAQYVDGFRCDVAPMIPIEFWEYARTETERVRPGCIWLSESIDPGFIRYLRSQRITAHSDCEMYRAFDIIYDYDIYGELRAVFDRSGSLSDYAAAVNRQEYIYPANYVKLNFLENHDQPRARHLIPDVRLLRNWTAFMFFRKGMALVYNGQERGLSHLPDLFDKDDVEWDSDDSVDLTDMISKLAGIKREPLLSDSEYHVDAIDESVLRVYHKSGNEKAVGIFSVKGEAVSVPIELEDGIYTNMIDGRKIEVFRGAAASCGEPVIIFGRK